MVNEEAYRQLKAECDASNTTLVAVSKTKPVEDVQVLYNLGQRDFGENYVQELLEKQALLPQDIRWHFIGHLQTNKAKQIVPFVHLIHGVDTTRLLQEIGKQATKVNRTINCLLQVHIAQEETKYGMDDSEVKEALQAKTDLPNVMVKGLMGMASFTDDMAQVKSEFSRLKEMFDHYFQSSDILSMGMSGDYKLAIEKGSNMIRVGSLLFGARS
jgi:PLP dependent protein